MPLADAYTEIARAAATAVLPDPELRLDEWSEQHVVIPKGSAFSGRYSLKHTPPAQRILQCLSPGHPAGVVVAMIASQMLKTQVFVNAALGWMHSAPANILALEPTDGLAKRLSARLSKAIDNCDAVKDKVAAPRSRDKRNTIDAKEFDGGTLYITTAGADANLAEIPARYLFADEVDREGWRAKTGGEGNKLGLALARLTTYEGISKAYIVSSPTILGNSEIHEWFLRGTQEHYHVPCPHCGHLHELVRANFRWKMADDADRVERAWFICPECGAEIEEHHKADILLNAEQGGQARWVPTAAGDGETISVTLPAYCAPLGSITWVRLARELAQALDAKERGDDSLIQVYENTREGLPHKPGDVTSTADEIHKRAIAEGLPARIVPDRALVLTLYADTQPNRLECAVEAWGPGLERWTIEHQVLWGSPTAAPDDPDSVWAKFDELRRTPFAHASGALIRISAYGIDSGGANTQDVYNYAAAREKFGCLATKGASLRARPIIAQRPSLQDIDWQGKRVESGVKLWTIGADTAKDHIFNRIRLQGGAGSMHWFASMERELFEQLVSETKHTRFVKGRAVSEYIKPNGVRNEMLDIATGNLALAYYLGLHKWTQLDWDRLRQNILGRQATPDLFASAAASALPPTQPEPKPAHLQRPDGDEPPPAPAPAAPTATPPARPATPVPSAAPGRRVLSRGLR